MEQEAVYFRENGIIKSVFHKNKKPVNTNELDIEEIVLSHKKSYSKDSFKYFIGCRHKANAFLSPLCVKLPQMNTYAKCFDKDKEILKKHSEIWDKIKA